VKERDMPTTLLFRDDAYLPEAEATVIGVNDRRGIILDRTVFYATGGGQPGDSGRLEREGGGPPVAIATTVYGEDKGDIVHVPGEAEPLPEPGETVRAALDWARRYRHMRIHTGLHLLSVVLPFPVTGGAIGADEGRLDFDLEGGEVPAKEAIEEQLNGLVAANHPVSQEWITDDELLANPGLVKTMKVKPPMGTGRVRLVRIGDIDLQPCGGTHVRATGEIGRLMIGKIESKGRQNRRVRIRFADPG
jgi:misacylated tRNA(Ala) deacylase